MAAPVLRPLSTGEVLDTGFGLYRSLFFPLIIVAIACRTIPLILGIYLQQVSGTAPMAIFDHWKFLIGAFCAGHAAQRDCRGGHHVAGGGRLSGRTDHGQRSAAPGVPGDRPAHAGLAGELDRHRLGDRRADRAGLDPLGRGLVLASAVVVLEPHAGAMGALNRSWALTSGSRFKVFISIFVAALFFLIPAMIVNVFGAIASMAHARSPLATGVPHRHPADLRGARSSTW